MTTAICSERKSVMKHQNQSRGKKSVKLLLKKAETINLEQQGEMP